MIIIIRLFIINQKLNKCYFLTLIFSVTLTKIFVSNVLGVHRRIHTFIIHQCFIQALQIADFDNESLFCSIGTKSKLNKLSKSFKTVTYMNRYINQNMSKRNISLPVSDSISPCTKELIFVIDKYNFRIQKAI